MKKMITSVVVAAMLLSTSMTALAATIDTAQGTASKEVTATYVNEVTTPDVYDVDIAWDAMEFTYTISGTYVWDSEAHEYQDNTSTAWTSSENTVTVTNHSNKSVTATLTYDNAENDAITGEFSYEASDLDTSDGITLATAEGTAYENADAFVATLTLDGALSETETEGFQLIGYVTITLS